MVSAYEVCGPGGVDVGWEGDEGGVGVVAVAEGDDAGLERKQGGFTLAR